MKHLKPINLHNTEEEPQEPDLFGFALGPGCYDSVGYTPPPPSCLGGCTMGSGYIEPDCPPNCSPLSGAACDCTSFSLYTRICGDPCSADTSYPCEEYMCNGGMGIHDPEP